MSQIQQIEQCNTFIDYSSTVIEGKILPFTVELDVAASNLDPVPGENQRFCYNVSGIGLNNDDYADLSHLVLSICDEIPEDVIENITVIIDGIPQTVDFGEDGNVELFSPSFPDPATECPGLKFDFGLDKVEGEMTFCFELTTTYPVGPNEVCLFGANRTAEGLTICGPVCGTVVRECEAVAYQRLTVCVPVTITPFANTLPTTTFCCDDPIITPGNGICGGTENGSCTFTITQNICVQVPVEFGATPEVGDPFVQCGVVNDEECSECVTEDSLVSSARKIKRSSTAAKINCNCKLK